ncbi:MAG: DUF4230 domain-containing protein [Eggerthellaceae bacterium]|nr:DUF4230 domain-containing protein [Eggerthellaceae bacterium]
MANEVNIKSTSKRVKGEKSAEQDARLKAIEEKKAADRKAAAEADAAKQEAAKAAEEEKAKALAEEQAKAKEAEDAKREALEKLGASALAAGGAIVDSAAQSAKKGELKVSPKTAFFAIAAIVIVALLLFIAWPRLSAMLSPQPETRTAVELSESAIMGNTSTDISNAILGEARQKQELVVWEQDVQVDSEISQALANLAVFAKTKSVHSFGTGVFTVDMGSVDESAINVDEKSHVVTIRIPHTQLQYITKDLEKTEFEDTQHAILGFGDVKLTQEQQNLLERSIEDAMRVELESEQCFADADKAALLVVYDVYQPLITQVDDTYTLEVQFAE